MSYIWTLIEHDPSLSSELHRIEETSVNEEVLVGSLLDFYSRVDLLIAQGVIFIPLERELAWTNE